MSRADDVGCQKQGLREEERCAMAGVIAQLSGGGDPWGSTIKPGQGGAPTT